MEAEVQVISCEECETEESKFFIYNDFVYCCDCVEDAIQIKAMNDDYEFDIDSFIN